MRPLPFLAVSMLCSLPVTVWAQVNFHWKGEAGGDGSWTGVDPLWATPTVVDPVTSPWVNVTPFAIANFSGAAGTVSVDEAGLKAAGLVFNTDGYTLSGTQPLTLQTATGNATMTAGAGVTTTISANLTVVPAASWRKTGTGTIRLTGNVTATGKELSIGGGTVIYEGSTYAGGKFIVGSGAPSRMEWRSGTATLAGNYLGVGDGTTGEMVLSGGTINLNAAATGLFLSTSSTSGVLTVSGGTLNIQAGNFHVGATYNGTGTAASNGTLNLDSGTVTYGGAQNIKFTNVAAHTGVMNLTGGTFNLNGTRINKGAGDARFRFAGGTLRLTAANANIFGTGFNPLVAAGLSGEGSFINTNGFAGTIATALVHSTLPGDPETDGGLTKLGANTLTLSGANTYNGPTVVNAGRLVTTTASTGGGPLVLADNASLTIRVAAAGETFRASQATLGVATGAALDMDCTVGGNPSAPVLEVSGDLALDADINLSLTGPFYGPGVVDLIRYGSRSGSGSFVLTLPPGVTGNLIDDPVNKVIRFNLTSGESSLTWLGTPGSEWNKGVAGNLIWGRSAEPTLLRAYQEFSGSGPAVIFDDAAINAGGSPGINLTAQVLPSSVTFNSTAGYQLSGPGGIGGPGSLTKQNTGALRLDTVNTYTGTTTVSGGVLTIAKAEALGSETGGTSVTAGGALLLEDSLNLLEPLSLNGLGTDGASAALRSQAGNSTFAGPVTLAGATRITVDDGILTLSGRITGVQRLSVTGAGQLNLTGGTEAEPLTMGEINPNAGGTVVWSGIGSTAGTYLSAGDNSDGTFLMTGGSLRTTPTNSFFVGSGGNGVPVGRMTISGGTLTMGNNAPVYIASYNGTTGGTGILTVSTGGTFTTGTTTGAFKLGGGNGTGSATINLEAGGTLATSRTLSAGTGTSVIHFNGGTLAPTGPSFAISGLTRVNVRDGGAVIDTTAASVNFGQSLLHSDLPEDAAIDGGLTKTGPNDLTLTAAPGYTGDTRVGAGNLILNDATLAPGADVRIAADAVLTLNFGGSNTIDQLYLNGTAQAAGVWGGPDSNAANKTPYLAGTGVLQVTSGPGSSTNGYAAWAAQPGNGLTSGVNDGPAQDPDQDGVPNFLEFILAGHPTQAASSILPAVTNVSATDVTVTFRRADAAEAGITLRLQHSPDLNDWTDVLIGATSSGSVAVTESGSDPDTITVTLPRHPTGRLYTRLKASAP